MKNLLIQLKDWRNLSFIGALLASGAWIYSRVASVNPAILGDEYLYSINARHARPWDPSPAGDFSNYLFNLVYSSTNLCGPGFYTCTKVLNLLFFLAFAFTIFVTAKKIMNFWLAASLSIATILSPLSVYVSMFLPESMYFFMLGLVLYWTLEASRSFATRDWLIVGGLLGLASLVKPHAWLSAIAIGIYLLVVGLGNRNLGLKVTSRAVSALVAGAVLGRVVLGFIVGGPKAINFFGSYVNSETVGQITAGAGPVDSGTASIVGIGPLAGAMALFGPQLWTHTLVIFALMSVSIIALVLGLFDIFKTKELNDSSRLALLSFIWLITMVVEVVLFTGWITGGGDDHTTRVLLRYYEFLFIFVPLAGLGILANHFAERVNVYLRWTFVLIVGAIITPAFSGFFGTLTIQIADAPNLAGLVVNMDVFNGVAMTTALALLIFATAPKYLVWAWLLILPFSMVGTGWQIQDQYQGFRQEQSPADVIGKQASQDWSSQELESTYVVATSRFEATNFGFWADVPNLPFELYGPGSVLDLSLIPEGFRTVIAFGDLTLADGYFSVEEFEGYKIYHLKG